MIPFLWFLLLFFFFLVAAASPGNPVRLLFRLVVAVAAAGFRAGSTVRGLAFPWCGVSVRDVADGYADIVHVVQPANVGQIADKDFFDLVSVVVAVDAEPLDGVGSDVGIVRTNQEVLSLAGTRDVLKDLSDARRSVVGGFHDLSGVWCWC